MENKKGITLVPLIILIVAMLILLGITVKVSRDTLETSKAERLVAYMQLIELRANDYYEQIDFELGDKDLESYLQSIGEKLLFKKDIDEDFSDIEKIIYKKYYNAVEDSDGNISKEGVYSYTDYHFIKWDASKLKQQGIDNTILDDDDDEYFIVAYDNKSTKKVDDIYYSKGVRIKNEIKYSLSEMKQEIKKITGE